MLSAEASGLIELMDRIIEVNHTDVSQFSEKKLMAHLEGSKADPLPVLFESSTKESLWFECPHCSYHNNNVYSVSDSERLDGGSQTGRELTCEICQRKCLL